MTITHPHGSSHPHGGAAHGAPAKREQPALTSAGCFGLNDCQARKSADVQRRRRA